MHAAIAFAALVASANAYAYNYSTPAAPVYVTTYVTDLTTVCSGPTEIPIAGTTYTITEATTLTIHDCSCTITYPAETPAPSAPVETPVYTSLVVPSSAAAPYPSSNATTPIVVYPTGTAPATTTAPPAFTGAAAKAAAGGLAGLAALAAFL